MIISLSTTGSHGLIFSHNRGSLRAGDENGAAGFMPRWHPRKEPFPGEVGEGQRLLGSLRFPHREEHMSGVPLVVPPGCCTLRRWGPQWASENSEKVPDRACLLAPGSEPVPGCQGASPAPGRTRRLHTAPGHPQARATPHEPLPVSGAPCATEINSTDSQGAGVMHR